MDNQEYNSNNQPQQPPPLYPPPQYGAPQNPPPPPAHQTGPVPGKTKAIVSLVLGIVSLVFSYIPFLGLAAGIVGLIFASMSKKEGFVGGLRTAGFVCSLIGVIGGALITILIFVAGAFFVAILNTVGWHDVPHWVW